MNDQFSPIIELTRGAIAESVHYGAFAVVDQQGTLLASHGDVRLVIFPRSSAKPFQALPFMEINGDRHFGLSEMEVAIICASHVGSDDHVAVINSLQTKTGVKEEELLCGVHPPSDRDAYFRLVKANEQPTPNRNNCSGKHTGMLAHARLRNLPIEDYINPEHPLQQLTLKSFAEMCNLDVRDIVIGIDGCSAPNFAVPLASFALAMARLVDPRGLLPARAAACKRIVHAMTAHPEMVSGTNRFDTVLMQLGKGKIVAKGGAEGYQAIGLTRGALGKDSPAIGLAIKIADGDNADYQTAMYSQHDGYESFRLDKFDTTDRARPCVAIELLKQLGALDDPSLQVLSRYATRPIYNWRKVVVGEIRATFDITK